MRKLVQVDGVQAIITIYTNVVTAQMPLADELHVPTLSNILTPGLVSRSQFSFVHPATLMESAAPLLIALLEAARLQRMFAFFSDNALGQRSRPLARVGGAGRRCGLHRVVHPDLTTLGLPWDRGAREGVRSGRDLRRRAGRAGRDHGDPADPRARSAARRCSTPPCSIEERTWRASGRRVLRGDVLRGGRRPRTDRAAFIAAYRAQTGFNPDYNAAELYDMVMMYAAAIAQAGYDGDRDPQRDRRSTGVPSVFGGTITMGPNHYTVTSSVGLWQVRAGRLVRVAGS